MRGSAIVSLKPGGAGAAVFSSESVCINKTDCVRYVDSLLKNTLLFES